VLNTLGAKNAALIVYRHEWWRLLTPMLLHAGFIHLAVNVLIQLRVGVMLELEWGLKRFSVIYFVSGLTSSLLSCLALPDTIGVGYARSPICYYSAFNNSQPFNLTYMGSSLLFLLLLAHDGCPTALISFPSFCRSSGALMGILGAWFVEICCKWSSSTPEELPQVNCGKID